jgi:hypothetical protein
MRNPFSKWIILASVLTCLLVPAIGSADTLTVTSGGWTVIPDDPGMYGITGSNFSGGGYTGSGPNLGFNAAPGGTFPSLVSASTFFGAPHDWVVNGVTYPMGVGTISNESLHVTTAPFTMPSTFIADPFTMQTTATLTGSAHLCTTVSSCLDYTVSGQGTATFNFKWMVAGTSDGFVYNTRTWGATFVPLAGGGSDGAPVPEPASLLLLASGVAGFSRWRKR